MSQRKNDHISLAGLSAPKVPNGDQRFYYEPLSGAHPSSETSFSFMGKTMVQPLWISSMTGGTEKSGSLNRMLAEACSEFGLGMGLGSCRPLLEGQRYFSDYNLRPILGTSVPFFANIGIVQLEKLVQEKAIQKIDDLIIGPLKTDGLIIHLNPAQEFLQPEGDHQHRPAYETLEQVLEFIDGRYKVIVKEVGQGMGPKSLEQLAGMDIDGIEFGAFGGTNFATIELMRNPNGPFAHLWPIPTLGHTAEEMLGWMNRIAQQETQPSKPLELIISGGINNFLDGYYFTRLSSFRAVYGMANILLQQALKSKQDLFNFIRAEKMGFQFASEFLEIRPQFSRDF